MKSFFKTNGTYKAVQKSLFIFLCFFSLLTNAQIGTIKNLMYDFPDRYEIADMDNDGDLDVVCGSIDPSRQLYWYENTSPSAENWIIHTIDVPEDLRAYGDIKIADYNGDGWQDIFQINSYTFLNNGNPPNLSFTPVEITAVNPGSRGITGDIDNDGDIDLFRWTYSTGPNNFIYKNIDQDGTFGPAETINLPSPYTYTGIVDAEFFDLDQDNDLDIIATISTHNHPNTFVYWYENTDGQGSFEIAEIIYEQSYSEAGTPYLAVGHFNNDNFPDIVSANRSGLYLHSQNSEGWTTTLLDSGDYGHIIEAGDLDNDGDLDILEGRNTDEIPNWFSNIDNNGSFSKAPILPPGTVFSEKRISFPPLEDLDNDGDLDLIAICQLKNEDDGFFFFKNDLSNTGFFLDPIKFSDNANGYLNPLAFDVESDGDQDVIVLSQIDQEVYFLENNDNIEFGYQQAIFQNEQLLSIVQKDLDLDGDEDILAINVLEELVWYENISNGSIQFSEKQVLGFNNYPLGNIVAGDIDGDGDIDISTIKSDNQVLSLYEQISLDNFNNHILGSDSVETIAGIADFDQDGLKDIVFGRASIDGNPTELAYLKQNSPNDFSFVSIETFLGITKIIFTDIDNDLDPDLILRIYKYVPWPTATVFFNHNGQLEAYDLLHFLPANFAFDLSVYDLDNDGKKDVYDGTVWFKQLPESSFSSGLSIDHEAKGDFLIHDLTGDGYGDFIFSRHISRKDPLLYVDNQIGSGILISGQVRGDQDLDCALGNNDTISLPDLVIEFENNGNTYYTTSNSAGYYALALPDAGNYTVRVNTPNAYWSSCLNDSVLSIPADTSMIIDFPVQAEVECPLMNVDINSGPLRPWIEGQIYLNYSNLGTSGAEDVIVEVVIDENLDIDSTSIPFTETDTSLLFDIGSVGIYDSGNISLFVTPNCLSIETGDIVCFSASITPDSLCMPLDSLWDGSTIQVSGSCIDDSIHFNLQNIGIGSMDEARQFRVEIVNDDIVLLMQVDTFQLDPEETKTVSVAAEMDALRLEADQDEDHPYLNTASATVAECADFNFILNLIPDEDANPFYSEGCREITSSYDPNLKEAIPIGYSSENLIDKSWELEYTIHFQNTGNDTAFNVVIKDPISEHLDLSTLRIGVASHPFHWELNPQREITFNFNDILLPDSTTNLILSQGFVQFFISPSDTAAFATKIENRAAIFFDFNEPIITDPVVRTIRTPVFASSAHFDICKEDYFEDIQIFNDTTLIDSMLTAEGLFLDFHHIHALEIAPTEVDTMIPFGTIFNNVEIVQDTILSINELSINGCDSLVIYTVSILTSVDELEKEYALKITPIPTKDYLTIHWNNAPLNLSLLSPNGQRILERQPNYGSVSDRLNLTKIAAGVYILKISFPEGDIYKRVVKF